MKHKKLEVVQPTLRTDKVREFARQFGCDWQGEYMLRITFTPKPLLVLPDHSSRGKKSLGRIQQLTNRRRFKHRPAV